MAIGADELPFHDWQVVDPASMAYIRHLVESLEHLTFDDACMLQLDGGENASDLFNLHRPVITGVPHDVASALNTLEEILSRGSPTLDAYQREDIRETRVLQEEKVRTTMAEVRYIDGLVDEHMDAVEGTRVRLHAARDTKQQLVEMITAVAADGGEQTVDVASLELELSEAEESEAALLAEFMNQWQSVLAVHKHRGVAKSRFEDEVVALMAIPQLPGHSEDQHLVGDAEERYEDSVLLDEFLDMQY
uniref:Uncharacterized protein n=1 Tax=Oryza glaberrima TaxID=4538 RepID=I1R5Z4_ORYGL